MLQADDLFHVGEEEKPAWFGVKTLLVTWDWEAREGVNAVEQFPRGRLCLGWFLSVSQCLKWCSLPLLSSSSF